MNFFNFSDKDKIILCEEILCAQVIVFRVYDTLLYKISTDNAMMDPQMLDILRYARRNHKYLVGICDTSMPENSMEMELSDRKILLDRIYCISEDAELEGILTMVAKERQVSFEDILYISSEMPPSEEALSKKGFNWFCYASHGHVKKKRESISEIDAALCNVLCDEGKGFWYNLGIQVGGPLYMGLFLWLEDQIENAEIKVFFLDEGAYHLYFLFEQESYKNIIFLNELPETDESMISRLQSVGFFEDDNIVFCANLDGIYQKRIEECKRKMGCTRQSQFFYLGILHSETNCRNLCGRRYEVFAFDHYNNYILQNRVKSNRTVWDLFFSLPYGMCEDLANGIRDYVRSGIAYARMHKEEFLPRTVLKPMMRLLASPTYLEKKTLHELGIRISVTLTPQSSEYDIKVNKYHNEKLMEERREQQEIPEIKPLSYQPMFSVVIPVYNVESEHLIPAIESVLAQNYRNYELILVDDHSTWENVVSDLNGYKDNPRVKLIFREHNGHISKATNDGIQAAVGEFIVFMDCDDMIEPYALYCLAEKLNGNPELDFLYSDEDTIAEDGSRRINVHYKPDWSPAVFDCEMYTNHLSAYRRSIIMEIGGLRTAYNGSQDYDMTLRFLEKTRNDRVGHIDRVLYHWRAREESVARDVTVKDYALDAAKHAKEDAIKRRKIVGYTEEINNAPQYRIVYEPASEPMVSVIVIAKDQTASLRCCLESLRKVTSYQHYEIIVIDGGSSLENRISNEEYLQGIGARYIYGISDYNISKIYNVGAGYARGEYLLFLHAEITFFQQDWLQRMVGQAMQPQIGAVGNKLYYPFSTIVQQFGIGCSEDKIFCDYQYTEDRKWYGIGMYNWMNLNCLATTWACMLVKCKIFEAMRGFDEDFPELYGDVEFCFRLYEAGYYQVVRADSFAYNHRSIEADLEQAEIESDLEKREREKLFGKHPNMAGKDPFRNRNGW